MAGAEVDHSDDKDGSDRQDNAPPIGPHGGRLIRLIMFPVLT